MVFLRMLENRASTNGLTAEIRNDLLEIVQECQIYIYRRYLQEAMQNPPAAVDPDLPFSVVPPSQPSSHDPSDGTSHEVPRPSSAIIDDFYELDPDNLESIFQEDLENTLNSWAANYAPAAVPQSYCSCDGPCFCIPSHGTNRNPPWMR